MNKQNDPADLVNLLLLEATAYDDDNKYNEFTSKQSAIENKAKAQALRRAARMVALFFQVNVGAELHYPCPAITATRKTIG